MRFVICFWLFRFCTAVAHADCLRYQLVDEMPDILLCPLSEKIGHTWVDGVVWDKPFIQKVYLLLKDLDPSFTAIDLGAQTGSFSLLAKFFPSSHWISFEPLQEAVDVLLTNLEINNINNVDVYAVAVSNTSGNVTLQLPEMNAWGLTTCGANVLRFTPITERVVPCIDLDQWADLFHLGKVDFIKLDIEGWELHALEGAQRLIERDLPIIVMEYNRTNMRQCGICCEEVDEWLQNRGYHSHLISDEDLLCLPPSRRPFLRMDGP